MKNKKTTVIFFICYIAYTAIYIARLNLTTASPGLVDARILDTVQIGLMGSAFSIIYSVGRLLNGRISDSQPPCRMICIGLVLAGISNIAISFFPPFEGILFLWGCNAFAQSMLWSSILRIIASLYDEETARQKTSYMVTSVAVGNIAGILLNTYIITGFGLSFAFLIPGALTILLATFVLFSTKEIARETASKEHLPMLRLLSNKEIRLSLVPAVLHGVMKDNISLWMTVYFVDRFLVDLNESAYFVLFIPIMGFIGRMVYPLCYKLCGGKEHRVSFYAFFVCAVAAMPIGFNISSPIVAALCLSLIYTAVSVANTSFLSILPIRFASTGNVASVSGIMDFATYLGAGIGSMVFGIVIKHFGYSPMYLSWSVISLISMIILRCMFCTKMDEKTCKSSS